MISVRLPVPNECPEGASWLPLSKGLFALIDKSDVGRLSHWLWSAMVRRAPYTPYAMRRQMYKTIYLHRFVVDAPDGMDVDHINGNGIDCRKSNLRVCTHAENQRNYTKTVKPTSSKFKGVSLDNNRNLWCAKLKDHGQSIDLGRFASEEDAAKVYDEAARRHFGEFAKLNFPASDGLKHTRFLFRNGLAGFFS